MGAIITDMKYFKFSNWQGSPHLVLQGEEEMKEIRVIPVDDRVVIRPIEIEEKSVGGIIIPESAKEKPSIGVLVSKGKGVDVIYFEPCIGQMVVYNKFGCTEINTGREKLLITASENVISILVEVEDGE